MYKSIDLFAGIGGIRIGFDNAFGKNIQTVFVSEWDEPAQQTYKANFNDDFEIDEKKKKIKEEDIPDFDICFLLPLTFPASNLYSYRLFLFLILIISHHLLYKKMLAFTY